MKHLRIVGALTMVAFGATGCIPQRNAARLPGISMSSVQAPITPTQTDLRRYAEKLPIGCTVLVEVMWRSRIRGILTAVDSTHIVVRPNGPFPEPTQDLRFDQITLLERAGQDKVSVGKRFAIDMAVVLGVILVYGALARRAND